MDGPNWQRRAILAGGFLAVVGWAKGSLHLLSQGKVDLEFEAIPDLTPFCSHSNNGATTSGAAIFAGSALVDAVMVSWNANLGAYRLEMRGKLLDVQQKAKPAVPAGVCLRGRTSELGFVPMVSPTLCPTLSTALKSKFFSPLIR